VEAPSAPEAEGPAAGAVGLPLFATSDELFKALAGIVASGVEAVAGYTADIQFDVERSEVESSAALARGYRRALEEAASAHHAAMPSGHRVVVHARVVSIEPIRGDGVILTIETVGRDSETGEVLLRRVDRARVSDPLNEISRMRTSKPPHDLGER
jgi:hypothetical protein